MRHPSLTCRAAHRCPAPPVARLSVLTGGLIAIRPIGGPNPAGVLTCADHLHSAVDELLMAAMPKPEARP